MAYRWGQQGPAFEFPTPYAIENRFLRLRAYGLIATAVLMAVVLAVLQGGSADADGANLILSGDPAESGPGSPVPHLLAGLLLVVLGVLDWVRAAGQRALLLAPGEPASLAPEVRREAAGSSAGVPWLLQALHTGRPATQPDSGLYSGVLNRLSPHVAGAPLALRDHLRVRLGNLPLAGGLLVLLLVLVLLTSGTTPLLTPPPGSSAAIAGWLMVLGCAPMAVSRLGADQTALSPGRVVGLLLPALLGSGALWYLAAHVPALATQMAKLDRLALPLAAGVVLAGVLCIELLALLAGRQQLALLASGHGPAAALATAPAAATEPDAASLLQADPHVVMQEIDRELHRRWTEGIPNRRHAWQPPQLEPSIAPTAAPQAAPQAAPPDAPQPDAQTESGRFNALVLEESQPMLPPGARPLNWAACRQEAPLRSLLLLGGLGLLLTAAACVGWVVLAWTHSHSMAAPWTWGVTGLMALLLGGHALRVAHLLWSRQEAQSTITVLQMDGAYRRPAAAATAGAKALRSTAYDPWRLQARVLEARSVFYAAGRHGDGSRALLGVRPDMPAAAAWVQQMQAYARGLPVMTGVDGRAAASTSAPASSAALAPAGAPASGAASGSASAPASAPAHSPATAPARPRMGGGAAPPAAPRAPARFCPSCGTPLLQGARFCQQCGHQLPA